MIAKQRKSTKCVCWLRRRGGGEGEGSDWKSQNDWVPALGGRGGGGVWVWGGASPSWSLHPCGPLRMSYFFYVSFSFLCGAVLHAAGRQTGFTKVWLYPDGSSLRPPPPVRPSVWGVVCCSCEMKINLHNILLPKQTNKKKVSVNWLFVLLLFCKCTIKNTFADPSL